MELTFLVNNQSLIVQQNIEKIVAGSIQYLDYNAIFSKDWEGLVKKFFFVYENEEEIEREVDEDGINYIPEDVIWAPGFLVRVEGYSEVEGKLVKVITTNHAKVKVHEAEASTFAMDMSGLDTNLNPESENAVQNRVLYAEFQNVYKDIEVNTTAITGLQEKVDGIEESLTNSEVISELQTTVQSNTTRVENVEKSVLNISTTLTTIKDLGGDVGKLTTRVEDTEDEVDRIDGLIGDINTDIDNLQKFDGQLGSLFTEVGTYLDNTNKRLDNFETTYSSIVDIGEVKVTGQEPYKVHCYSNSREPAYWYFSTDTVSEENKNVYGSGFTYLNIKFRKESGFLLRTNGGVSFSFYINDGVSTHTQLSKDLLVIDSNDYANDTMETLFESRTDFIVTDEKTGDIWLKIPTWYTLYFSTTQNKLILAYCTDQKYKGAEYIPLITPFTFGDYPGEDALKGHLDSFCFYGPLGEYLLQDGDNKAPTFNGTEAKRQSQEYTKAVADSGKSAGSFLFFTDPHWYLGRNDIDTEEVLEDNQVTISRNFNELDYIYKNSATDFIVCGGDWIAGGITEERMIECLSDINEKTKEKFGNDYYHVLGNHDTLYYPYQGATKQLISHQKVKNLWSRNGLVKEDCFYYDFTRGDIHYYVLDSGTGYDDTDKIWFGNDLSGQTEQRTWLINKLNNQQEDYAVIFTHICEKWISNDKTGGLIPLLNNILTDIEDFNENNSKKVIALFGGHSHLDRIYKPSNCTVSLNGELSNNNSATVITVTDDYKSPSVDKQGNMTGSYDAHACIPIILTTASKKDEVDAIKADLCNIDIVNKKIYIQRVYHDGDQGVFSEVIESKNREIDFSYLYN